jgi:ATP-binding cassette subfamily F protein 3
MIALEHISQSFGECVLFDDVTFTINPHDRIGLVGANGTGKSTLLRIIAQREEPTSGKISKAKFVTVGYLPQECMFPSDKTVFEEGKSAFEHIVAIQERIEEVQKQLLTLDQSDPSFQDVLEVYGELQHRLEDFDVYRMKSRIEEVFLGLGFSNDDLRRKTSEFSGGWQMRIALAKLLLQKPNLLLLDEPTNHLDLPSLQWLENFLRQYDGAIILVSHDRAFLDALTTKTIALSHRTLRIYEGNYSAYRVEEEKQREILENQYIQQQKYIEDTQEFIDRFRYKATKARQVQSRIKQLEKLERITLDQHESTIQFQFPPTPRCGKNVLELHNVSKLYDSKAILKDISLTISRGDKIAVVGVNGAGKSTLLRILAGVESYDDGERIVGSNVQLAYFAQHQADELDPDLDVLTTFENVAASESRVYLRTLLGSFLFHGDDVFKKVRVLSGGEKSRLALAKILVQQANVLLLDEPTNHLDMDSKEILQKALSDYNGTLIIVSHDRAFLDPLISKVWEVGNCHVKEYLGNLTEYLQKKQTPQQIIEDDKKQDTEVPSIWHQQQQMKKARSREQRRLEKQIAELETRIETLESQKSKMEELLANPDKAMEAGQDITTLSLEYQNVQSSLETAYSEWAEITEALDRFTEINGKT